MSLMLLNRPLTPAWLLQFPCSDNIGAFHIRLRVRHDHYTGNAWHDRGSRREVSGVRRSRSTQQHFRPLYSLSRDWRNHRPNAWLLVWELIWVQDVNGHHGGSCPDCPGPLLRILRRSNYVQCCLANTLLYEHLRRAGNECQGKWTVRYINQK